MNMENKYTPELIATSQFKFSIPLYQRLFAWKKKEVTKLLFDLKEHFAKMPADEPYYLGMLTCIDMKNHYDLIDGQQRFTVITLFAIIFKEYDDKWSGFLMDGNRLNFIARSDDKAYIKSKIKGYPTKAYVNKNMEEGLAAIKGFLESNFNTQEERIEFVQQVFTRLTFFFSYLPSSYLADTTSLNKYFEAMNAQGKGLEQHEILKVQLMRGEKEQDYLTHIWNLASMMDHPIIAKEENQDEACYRQFYEEAISLCRQKRFHEALEKCRYTSLDDEEEYSIDVIQPEKIEFKQNSYEDGENSIISFPEFLLLVLDVCTGGEQPASHYQPDKLIEKFDALKTHFTAGEFYEKMLYYRLLLDYYTIRRDIKDGQGNYSLILKGPKDDNDKLKQYQSMLYVSTEAFYNWLKPYLRKLEQDELQSCAFLKKEDNERHGVLPARKDLSYKASGNIRYWFWRLDYYLWEQRSTFFNEEEQKIVGHYVFRRNRSIEHLHPQDESHNEEWEEEAVHSFGNLAMISQSFNSQQSNDHIQIKFARIHEQISNKSLQSIKMFLMCKLADFNYQNWTMKLAKEHEDKMIEFLRQSYVCDIILSGPS